MTLSGLIRNRLTALLFPPVCVVCNQPLPGKEISACCHSCRQSLLAEPSACCPKCAAEFRGLAFPELCCRLCRTADFRFLATVSLGNYRDRLQQLIIELKRRHDESLAYQLGRMLGEKINESKWVKQIDLLVPIPIHWSKRLQKGFHAASVIAEGVADVTLLPTCNRALRSMRRTAKQGTLDIPDRIRNVKGAIGADRIKSCRSRNVLLVDDVMTSGATANEAAQALLAAGAGSVRVAVIARGTRAAS